MLIEIHSILLFLFWLSLLLRDENTHQKTLPAQEKEKNIENMIDKITILMQIFESFKSKMLLIL